MEQKTQKILIISLVILVLLTGGYILYDKVIHPAIQNNHLKYYNQGVHDVAQNQTQTGMIIYLNENGIQSININQLCQGIQT